MTTSKRSERGTNTNDAPVDGVAVGGPKGVTVKTDPPDVIHDPNQTGTDQTVETLRQQTRDAPEFARAIENHD